MALKLFAGIGSLAPGDLRRNVVAGVTLASMNVPQVLGYTRIAGMPVVTGLYTLLLPLVAFALFGSSRHLVVAADSATAAIFAAAVAKMAPLGSPKYIALVGTVALLTAGLLLIARVFRFGFIADFLSRTVLAGFLAGVGVQVGVAVLGEMLGLPAQSHQTVGQLLELLPRLPQAHLPTLAISLSVVAVLLVCKYRFPRLPAALFVMVGGIVASVAFDFAGMGVTVIGPVPGGLPSLALPDVTWQEVVALLPVAVSCFVIIVAQSAATSRVFAVRYRERVDVDADILGLAAANAAAACSGTFVVNGSLTQTEMADQAGARSQLAQVVAAAVVLLVLLFLTGPLQHLPRGVLAGLVFTIAVGLADPAKLLAFRKESPGEFKLAVVTLLAVALVGVQEGILLAMGLSLLRHVRHSYLPHTMVLVREPDGSLLPIPASPGAQSEPGLIIYRFGADLFYANETHFADEVRGLVAHAPAPVRRLVIDSGAISDIDFSAARMILELHAELQQAGVDMMFGRVTAPLRADMDRHGITAAIGTGRIFESLHEAIAAARDSRGALAPGEPTAGTARRSSPADG